MLIQRTATALVLFIIVGLVFFAAPPAIFAAACWLMCIVGMYELAKMYNLSISQILATLVVNTAIVLLINKLNQDVSQLVRIVTVVTWCFVVPLVLIFTPTRFPKPVIAILSTILFVPAYYALVVLHALFGPWQLISIMAIAWVADTGAYFIGKSIGKHKLAVKISPGKSIEGAIGGMVLVVIYLLILEHYKLVMFLPNPGIAIKFALILTTISIIGDLFESWLKRVAKVKDSSRILPGHGGVFDRIDSLIAVLAIAFALIRGMI